MLSLVLMSTRFFLVAAAIILLFLGSGQLPVAAMSGIGPRGEPLSDRQITQCLVSAPRIHYPMLSRRLRSRGSGLYQMRVDPRTGNVREVVILKSTGARMLDIECMRAPGHRFKPAR